MKKSFTSEQNAEEHARQLCLGLLLCLLICAFLKWPLSSLIPDELKPTLLFPRYNRDNTGMMRQSTRTHVTRRRQERNSVIISMTFPGLVAGYCLRDILTVDVNWSDVCGSPVAGKSTEETFKEIPFTNADATEKLNQ